MKKVLLSFVFLFVMTPMLLSSFSFITPIGSFFRDSNSSPEISETHKAREETVEAAESIVQKLAQNDVFSYELGFTTEAYYETAKWVAVELDAFEAEPDASLSLIEVYEDLLSEARVYNFEAYFAEVKAISDMQPEKPSVLSEEYVRGTELLEKRETVEALLALDVYYDRLDQNDLMKMTGYFEEFARLRYVPAEKICGSAYPGTLFEIYRRSRNELTGGFLLGGTDPTNCE